MVDLNLQSARRQFRWLAVLASALGLMSAWGARDHVIWMLEVLPVFLIGTMGGTSEAPYDLKVRFDLTPKQQARVKTLSVRAEYPDAKGGK